MKIKFFYKIILIIVVLLNISSCEQNNNNSTSVLDNPYVIIDTTNLSNPNNQFDSCGSLHNDFINYYESQLIDIHCLNFLNELKNKTITYATLRNLQFDSLQTISFVDSLINNIISNPNVINIDSVFSYYQFDINIETEMNAIIDTISNYQDTNSINDLIYKIKSWENNMINSANFTVNEKVTLLQFGATLRYSLAYWWTAAHNSNNRWSYYFQGCNFGLQQIKKEYNNKLQQFDFGYNSFWYKVIAVVVSDVVGYAKFGIIGAAVSSAITAAIVFSSH
jgi:hypothetical protein